VSEREKLMQQASNLIRRYPSRAAFEQDAVRLARLGYVVLRVDEQERPHGWVKRLLHSLAPLRLVVTYSDQGIVW
jgi:hypothetical protein